jgi:hypothetical protein
MFIIYYTIMAIVQTQSAIQNMETEKNDSHSHELSLSGESNNFHKLSDTWILWAHLPHDTDWSIKSYIKSVHLTRLKKQFPL